MRLEEEEASQTLHIPAAQWGRVQFFLQEERNHPGHRQAPRDESPVVCSDAERGRIRMLVDKGLCQFSPGHLGCSHGSQRFDESPTQPAADGVHVDKRGGSS